MPTRGPKLRRERNSLALWVLPKHKECARDRGGSEKLPDWVKLNHFSTWLRESGILAAHKKVRGQRGLGMGWRDGILGNPGGAPDGSERAIVALIWRCCIYAQK